MLEWAAAYAWTTSSNTNSVCVRVGAVTQACPLFSWADIGFKELGSLLFPIPSNYERPSAPAISVGAAVEGADVEGAAVVGTAVLGAAVEGAAVVGAAVVGAARA